MLVDGPAIVLASGGDVMRLDSASPVARFSGDAATEATLPAGPIRDLNIMTRRARVRHRLWVSEEGAVQAHGVGCTGLVVALRDGVVAVGDATTWRLDRLDTLRFDGPATPHRVSGLAIRIEIIPQPNEIATISSPASGGPASG